MGRLNFKDIGDDWTPSAISIVDIPDHPLAVFEVYENDEEFVKKSIDISEVENMTNKNNNIDVDIGEDTQMVSGPVSFFERLLDKVVTKSTEPPAGSIPQEQPEKNNEITNEQIMAKLESLEKRMNELEKEKNNDTVTKQQENNNVDPVPGTVTKQQENNNIKNNNTADNNANNDPTENVVTKSRQVDPDSELVVTKSSKTLMERLGRDENGMTW